MQTPPVARVRTFVIRHRASIQDVSLIAMALLLAGYLLLELDVFMSGGAHTARTIEADELPILGFLLSLGMFVFSVRRSREQKRETRRRIEAEKHARSLALEDSLTGLPNRRRFTEALTAGLSAPPSSEKTHALLMLDMNGFKRVNDVFGHNAGDEVLTAVARRLAEVTRQGDLAARLGGDEFAILAFHLAGAEDATSLALRVLKVFSEPVPAAGSLHHVGAGMGICLFPFAGASAEETMRRADVALYKAKAREGGAFRFFDDDMDEQVRQRETIERALRAALDAGSVVPHYQPLVDLTTRRVIGFEALARWTDPVLGEVPPERFIPIADDAGLLGGLTDRLLREACGAAREWPAEVTLSFNISPSQLKDQTTGLRILAILGETGLPPSRLEIEITESALVADLPAAKQVLEGLRRAGVRIALDDFGTGYSSLYHLRNFELDKIKIDRSFVQSMRSEQESAAIVSALVGLGRGLGLTITAEGVEDEAQQAALAERGCDQGQGFLFSKAVPAEEALRLCGDVFPADRFARSSAG